VETCEVHTKTYAPSWFWHYHKWMTPSGGNVSQWLDNALSCHLVEICFDFITPCKRDGASGGYCKSLNVFVQMDLHWFTRHCLQLVVCVEHVFEFLK
ncbi:hypothetical protein LSAT2_019360, partial [Lamellibrachia satsuma]